MLEKFWLFDSVSDCKYYGWQQKRKEEIIWKNDLLIQDLHSIDVYKFEEERCNKS